MTSIGTVFREWFTGRGNVSFELGRALWALCVLAMIAYQGMAIWFKGQPFSPIEFGTGVAAILAAGGIGIAAKDRGIGGAPQKTTVAGNLNTENIETVEMKP